MVVEIISRMLKEIGENEVEMETVNVEENELEGEQELWEEMNVVGEMLVSAAVEVLSLEVEVELLFHVVEVEVAGVVEEPCGMGEKDCG